MSIFDLLNKGKDIFFDEKNMIYVVNKTKLKNDCVYLNHVLSVPENYDFVFGKRGKSLDCFKTGEYSLSFESLPYCVRKLHLSKDNFDGQLKCFYVDGYYVSKQLFKNNWKTQKFITTGNKKSGYLKYTVSGYYVFKVGNTKEFMQSLLNEFSYIKSGEAEKILNDYVEECVLSFYESNKFCADQIVEKDEEIQKILQEQILKLMEKWGIELVDFQIENYSLPNSLKNSKNQLQNEINEKLETRNHVAKNVDSVNFANIKKEENFKNVKQKNYTPFANITIQKTYTDASEPVQFKNENINFLNEILQNEEPQLVTLLKENEPLTEKIEKSNGDNFFNNTNQSVDLNLNNLYNTNTESIVCKNCNNVNSAKNLKCTVCGKFLRR